MIFFDQDEHWANGHERVMKFFELVMTLLAESGFKESSPKYKKAASLLLFPEPPEFCLGTSEDSIFGAGSAGKLREGMLKGIAEATNVGIDALTHFEELALLGDQIGPDRIGDMTCNILKADFIAYTQRVAERHNIPMQAVNVGNIDWDPQFKMWKPGTVQLPLNPRATAIRKRPVGVILTPKRFLRQIPSVDPSEFWEYAWSHGDAQQLKAEFSYEVASKVDRGKIIKLARRHHSLLRAYLAHLEEKKKPAYDVDQDPNLIVVRKEFAQEVADTLTVGSPKTKQELDDFVKALILNFKWFVESRGGWKLLWVDNRPRYEWSSQTLFHGSAVWACKERDVDLTGESDAGRGPVDFKLSRGWKRRVLVELKLASSSSLKRNLKNQTWIYSDAEDIDHAYFVIIQHYDKDLETKFVEDVHALAKKVAEERKFKYEVIFVDARQKKSASKV